MEHIKIEILGNIHKYSYIVADYGYCFYDVDDEQRYYMTSISTPIIDEVEIARKYVVVEGNADDLNAELEKERSAEYDK